jgi:hypothetical protein
MKDSGPPCTLLLKSARLAPELAKGGRRSKPSPLFAGNSQKTPVDVIIN